MATDTPTDTIIAHFSVKVLVKVSVIFLVILPIDRWVFFGYTEARKKNQDKLTVKKTEKKGLIPMAFGETPPNYQNRINAERNESKVLV